MANNPTPRKRACRRSWSVQSRLRAILPLLHFRARTALGQRPLILLLPSGVEVTDWEELLRHRAREVRTSERTLYRWLHKFDESGERGLRDAPRRDKGLSKTFRKYPGITAFVLIKHAEGSSVGAIHGKLVREWPQLYPESRCPSYCDIRFLVRSTASSALKKIIESSKVCQ